MNDMSTVTFPNFPTNTNTRDFDALKVDNTTHAHLVSACTEIAQSQALVMDQIKVLKQLAEESSVSTSSNTPAIVDTTIDAAALIPLSAFERELCDLDGQIARLKNEMKVIEARVLTYDPKHGSDAAIILGFVARMLEVGQEIDGNYLADVLTSCTQAINNDSAPTPAYHS